MLKKRSRIGLICLMAALLITVVFPGMAGAAEPTYYTVKAGDSLSAIAKEYKTTPAEIAKENGIKEQGIIHVGQVLKIPQTAQADAAQESEAAPAASQPQYKPGHISLYVRDGDIRDALSALAVNMGYSIVYTGNPVKVSIKVENVKPETAMDYLLKLAGMTYIRDGDIMIVGTREALSEDFMGRLAVTTFKLKYITGASVADKIQELEINAKPFTMESNPSGLWVQGFPQEIAKVRQLINLLDIPENENISANEEGGNGLTAVRLTYFKPSEFNSFLQSLGIHSGLVLSDGSGILWVYGPSEERTEILDIRNQVDNQYMVLGSGITMEKLVLSGMSKENALSVLSQLDLKAQAITVNSLSRVIWLRGASQDVQQAMDILQSIDSDTYFDDSQGAFINVPLRNVRADVALAKLDRMNLPDIDFYTFNYPSLSRTILIYCNRDFLIQAQNMVSLVDSYSPAITLPVDTGESAQRLRARRDLLCDLIPDLNSASFDISANVSLDTDTSQYVLYVTETPETIKLIQEMVDRIDNPWQ